MQFDSENYVPTEFTPPEKGDYGFAVMNAQEGFSKAGNPMITLELGVEVGRSEPLTCYAYLVSSEKALYQIDAFCKCVGLADAWKAGTLTDVDCLGKSGKAHFAPEKSQNGKEYLKVQYWIESKFEESPARTTVLTGDDAKRAAQQVVSQRSKQEKLEAARQQAAKIIKPKQQTPEEVLAVPQGDIPF